MRAFRSLILATGLVIATSAAHASARVFVTVGPSGYPAYAAACPGPEYRWTPAYYAYGHDYPGRWVADRDFRDREWREHHDRDRDRFARRDRDDRRDHDEHFR